METSQKSTQKSSPTLTASSVVSLARRFLSRASGEVSLTPEELYSSTWRESLKKNNHAFLSLRTSKAYYLTTKGEPLELSSVRLMSWGMTVNGKCLTAKITESPRTESASTLSDILEEQPDPKYFLSEKATTSLLNKGMGKGASVLLLSKMQVVSTREETTLNS